MSKILFEVEIKDTIYIGIIAKTLVRLLLVGVDLLVNLNFENK